LAGRGTINAKMHAVVAEVIGDFLVKNRILDSLRKKRASPLEKEETLKEWEKKDFGVSS